MVRFVDLGEVPCAARRGQQRKHHAHILTATRVLSAEGLTDRTRIIDAASTGGLEIETLCG